MSQITCLQMELWVQNGGLGGGRRPASGRGGPGRQDGCGAGN